MIKPIIGRLKQLLQMALGCGSTDGKLRSNNAYFFYLSNEASIGWLGYHPRLSLIPPLPPSLFSVLTGRMILRYSQNAQEIINPIPMIGWTNLLLCEEREWNRRLIAAVVVFLKEKQILNFIILYF